MGLADGRAREPAPGPVCGRDSGQDSAVRGRRDAIPRPDAMRHEVARDGRIIVVS